MNAVKTEEVVEAVKAVQFRDCGNCGDSRDGREFREVNLQTKNLPLGENYISIYDRCLQSSRKCCPAATAWRAEQGSWEPISQLKAHMRESDGSKGS